MNKNFKFEYSKVQFFIDEERLELKNLLKSCDSKRQLNYEFFIISQNHKISSKNRSTINYLITIQIDYIRCLIRVVYNYCDLLSTISIV